jgi:hypothetical protein
MVRDGASMGMDVSISIEASILRRRVKQVMVVKGCGWDVV